LALGPRVRPGVNASAVLRSVVPGEDLVSAALAGKRGEIETWLQNARGEEIPVRVAFLPAGSGSAVAVLTDLTKMRRLEQELRQRERLSLVGQLSAGVAHEVRNPLAGISSSAQVLLGRFEPRDERTRFVKAILDEVERVDRIVTQLLQFARPGEPRWRRGSLAETVRHLLEISGPWLAESGVEVETVLAPRVPESWFDPDLVHQVLLNLVSNAVQAMPKGGKLRISVRPLTRRGVARSVGRRREDMRARSAGRVPSTRVVQVRISDAGEGIAKENLSRLFDPFFTTKPSGTGLGLSICQSIVQEHGGSIHVASRLEHGTTVLVELPVDRRQGERRNR
ncbi:MAG TPA: ATP-binding protein, partial [Candidatus Eisenbacteria bacterium]|nr:ATP-binding protein [Candidatus Eisenbacteria bacterium]